MSADTAPHAPTLMAELTRLLDFPFQDALRHRRCNGLSTIGWWIGNRLISARSEPGMPAEYDEVLSAFAQYLMLARRRADVLALADQIHDAISALPRGRKARAAGSAEAKRTRANRRKAEALGMRIVTGGADVPPAV